MKKVILLSTILSVLFMSCNNEADNEDVVQAPNRSGSVEIAASTTPLKDSVVLSVTYGVYKNNVLLKTFTIKDTLPGLGITEAETEDNDGNTKKVSIPKQYEFYVTVK